MSALDRLVTLSIPMVPKPIVRRISARYIAGETLDDAVRVVTDLNRAGAMATLDVLGEDVFERKQCTETVDEYLRVLDAIVAKKLDCNISIKATAFGLKLDLGFCHENIERLLRAAHERGIFVRIDMEDSSVTTVTFDLFRKFRERFPKIGPVMQAYLRRSLTDAHELLKLAPLNIRLCKGIYKEKPDVAFQDREVVRKSYANILEVLMRAGAYVGIATHDEACVYEGLRLADALRLPREGYEFQMLLGVLPNLRKTLIDGGHRLRVYVPFGRHWYAYSRRRLNENPAIAGYVFKALLSANVQ